jgi:Ca2+-binding EF-hand superfamily protein
VDLQGLHSYYDIDGDGNIGYEEFIRAMKEPLSPMAKDFVLRAFAQLDRDGSGVATIKDIAHLYDVSENADFLDGIKTRDEILGDFLNSFDGLRGNADEQITQEEFLDYYSDLRAGIPSDEYFCRMLESTWGMAHEDASGEYRDHLKHILHLFRQRLITLSNGSQEEYKLKQLFDQFDLNRNQIITMDELAALMAKLGISVERKYLSALIGAIDRNGNGGIEF